MTFSDVEILWSHPWELTEREGSLVRFVLELKDYYELSDELDTDLRADLDRAEKEVDLLQAMVDRQDSEIAKQDAMIGVLMDYIDDLSVSGTADEFTHQHPLWRNK